MTELLRARRTGDRGPVVALIHGWGWDGRVLSPLAEALVPHARVVQPDLPGYGLNRDLLEHDFDACVELLDRSVPDAEVLLGWSLGGLLALAWAARRPMRRVALIGATPRFMWSADWPNGMAEERFDAFAADVQEDARRTRTRFAALAALGDVDARGTRASLAQWIDDQPPAPAALASGLEWLSGRDERDTLATLTTPTAWLHGTQDHVVDIACCRSASGAVGAMRWEVEGAAHLPWRQGVPGAFTDWLVAGHE